MNSAIYKFEFNNTILFLMCFLLAYYIGKPIVKELIKLLKEEKLEKSMKEKRAINV